MAKQLPPEVQKIKKYALDLALSNKEAEPGIIKIYWFPNDQEIRLIEVEERISPSTSGRIEPFYFDPSPRDLLPVKSAIALIHLDEAEKLLLPEVWQQTWKDAEVWESKTLDELQRNAQIAT